MSSSATERLKRPTLVGAPLFVLGLIGSSFAIALLLWAAWNPEQLGSSFWIPLAISAVIGGAGFIMRIGCHVELTETELRDVIGWFPIQRIDRRAIQTVRVRPGFWRWYELTLSDGSVRVLLGACPTQFPARLLETAKELDLTDMDLILGE